MRFNEKDLSYLYDIYEYSQEILIAIKGKKYYHFEKEKQIRLVVERCFEIIGIASTKLSDGARNELKHIPWRSIIGLRNIIAHEYGEIKLAKIWDFKQTKVPELINELKVIEQLKQYITKT